MKQLRTVKSIIILILIAGCTTSNNQDSTAAVNEAENSELFISSFDFAPDAPKGGELMGIIEIGYSGFNSFIVTMDKRDRWTLEKAAYDNSFVAEGEITFDYVISKIRTYRTEMIAHGVNEDNINLVASSSAIKDEKVQKIAAELRKMNIGLISVNATQEGHYALQATIPKDLRDKSFMIDIGSGNTKISWMSGNQVMSVETYGSKYYLDEVADQVAHSAMKEAISQVPSKNKTLCFLVGRIPYQLAEKTDSRSGRYTILEHPDAYNLSGIHETAGVNLYTAIWEESTHSYVFDWDSNFSIGVLMSVN